MLSLYLLFTEGSVSKNLLSYLEAELPKCCFASDFLMKNCHKANEITGEFFFSSRKCHTNEMSDLVQLMTQTLKLESKESCEDLLVPDPVSEFKLHRKYRDTLILHGKVVEEAEDLHFKQLPSGDQFILYSKLESMLIGEMCHTKKKILPKFFCFFIILFV